MRLSRIFIFIFLFVFISCNQEQKISASSTSKVVRSIASEKNNCICTREYNPVCGSDFQDYANTCEASCNGIDVTYPISCNKLNCNPLSKKVCAQPECTTDEKCSPKMYDNECEMIRDNARFIRENSCS